MCRFTSNRIFFSTFFILTLLNSLLHIKNADIYVTGSNSKFLAADIITEFRGRGDEIRIYPLIFREFVSVYDGTEDEASAIGSLTNHSKLAKTMKSVKNKSITDKTLKKYIDYLTDAFLVSKAKRFDIKGA